MDPELVDRIYESSLVPELWPGVLDELSQLGESNSGSLFIASKDVTSWTSSTSARETTARFVNEGWFGRGQFFARVFAACHAGFTVDEDVFTAEEQDEEPLYRDFWRPIGFGRCTGTIVPLPTGEKIVLGLFREYERGPFERAVVQKLDELRPHLARSALMAARLQLERARIASETLAALGLPALVLNEQGKVLAANSLVEALTGYIRWRAQDRVALKDKAADNLLRDAIAAIAMASGAVRSFPVRDTGEAMMVAHVIPIRLSARDIFVRCSAALVLTPVTANF